MEVGMRGSTRQLSLWCTEEELARVEVWDGLPQGVRAELVEHLVRVVVSSLLRSKEAQRRRGEHGVEGAADSP